MRSAARWPSTPAACRACPAWVWRRSSNATTRGSVPRESAGKSMGKPMENMGNRKSYGKIYGENKMCNEGKIGNLLVSSAQI